MELWHTDFLDTVFKILIGVVKRLRMFLSASLFCFVLFICVKKIINRNLLNKIWRPEMGALTPCEDSRDKQEGKRLFFPSKDMENHRHFVYFSPPNFLSPSTKVFFACHAGTYMWLTTVADPELQFSANSEKKKKFSAGEKSGSLLVPGQHLDRKIYSMVTYITRK